MINYVSLYKDLRQEDENEAGGALNLLFWFLFLSLILFMQRECEWEEDSFANFAIGFTTMCIVMHNGCLQKCFTKCK